MSGENRTKQLVETIDTAIEQAENLELGFVVGILMMARLEVGQSKVPTPPAAAEKVGHGAQVIPWHQRGSRRRDSD
jgi:hypothetical protein